ncbi:hypothetical protein N752_30335 [Desulforamulus aquiferis]|nr:copper amine oxidase N-terminal domain-containing protein [Desulforamulus aquiferis]RYD01297.1 hypothetical protein N752_30335 [Desulforamulus aquiferis]
MKKSFSILIVTVFLALALPLSAFAGIVVVIDGTPLSTQDEPVFQGGRLMVPMRVIFEKLGAKVEWDNGNITASKGNTLVQLKVDSINGKLNNRPHILPVAPAIIDGKQWFH